MIANGGHNEHLFRAGFMQSGSPIPFGDFKKDQPSYDHLVEEVGCSDTGDSLQCLREVPYAVLKAAINASSAVDSSQVSH